jgi:ABC-type transport system involved in multi-copper enzyme maturation permease subunit
MKKEYLLAVTPFLVILLSYGLFVKNQEIAAAVVVVIYLAFIFGFDRFKINLKSKTIEIKDENRDS